MLLSSALRLRASVRSASAKPRTRAYALDIAATILRHWPGQVDPDTESITLDQVSAFLSAVADFSAPRYNAMISALRGTVPTAASLRFRAVRLKDRAPISDAELARVLSHLDAARRSHGGLLVRFLAHSGLRINEARQVRWADIAADGIRLRGVASKNGRPRFIPLVNGMADVLEKLRAVTGGQNRVLPQGECRRALARACRLAGVRRLSHHDFRHLFATRCIESGVDLPTAARWLGHLDGGALLSRVYFHLADGHSRQMAERVKIGCEPGCGGFAKLQDSI